MLDKRTLHIPLITGAEAAKRACLRGLPPQMLTCAPWPDYPYHPKVSVRAAHDDQHIWLHYQVAEKTVRARTSEHQGEVWKDSCVEFFVSPHQDDFYYNFEFNGIGAIRLSAGKGRQGRRKAPLTTLSRIQTFTSFEKIPFEEKETNLPWEITVIIPVGCFFEHRIEHLQGQIFSANFYKCGDELTTPHFIAWNPIDTPQPDFHRPEHFGTLIFDASTNFNQV